MQRPAHIKAGASTMRYALAVILVLAIVLVGGGIWLVYLGATGTTTLSLFGTHLETQSVGVVGLVAGVVLGVIGVRRLLLSLERLGRM
jgi:hypothetical protein